MSRRDQQRIHQRRYEEKWKKEKARLIGILSEGRGCALCRSFKNLEIDHCDGRNYVLKNISSVKRIKKYLEEYESGVALRVLCRKCNALSGGGVRYGDNREEYQPVVDQVDYAELQEVDVAEADDADLDPELNDCPF